MPAIAVDQVRVHPGKVREFLALEKKAKRLWAKHGVTTRMFVSVLAGPNVGLYSVVFEAADLATLANALQNLLADPADRDLQQRMYGPDGVCAIVSFGQATEIPL